MSVFKSNYDTGTTITITLKGLTNTSVQSSAAVDNSTNLYLDVLVQLVLKSGTASANGFVNVYGYASADGGTTYPEGCGTDTGITLTSPTNLRLIGTVNMVASTTTYKSEPMSVAAAFGGVMPQHWGIAIENQSGGTFDNVSEANFSKLMQGIWGQSV